MLRTIYTSSARPGMTDAMIRQILEVSRANNARDGITGLLVYHGDRFFQVLEGHAQDIAACRARIDADARHRRVRTLASGPVADRAFGDWRMGYATPDDLDRDARDCVTALCRVLDDPAMVADETGRLRLLLGNFMTSVGAGRRVRTG